MVLAMLAATVFLIAVCFAIGSQRRVKDPPTVPADVTIPGEQDILTDNITYPPVSTGDILPSLPANVPETDSSSVTTVVDTTSAPSSETQSTATTLPHSPVVVLPPDYQSQRVVCSGIFTVTTESANVRDDADRNARLVKVIYAGESYEVIAQKPSSSGILWFEILLGDGSSGYVSSSYGSYDGKIANGKVYLTFDDGPSDNTLRILDTLDRYGVKATFFVIYHPNREQVYRSIVERGHVIAVHSYTHTYSQIYSDADAFHRDIRQLSDYIYDLTGVRSNVLRFPGGSSNTISQKYCPGIMTELTRSVQDHGYSYYDWDVDSGDADAVTVPKEKILSNIKERIGNRRDAIILLHDAASKTTTADALPEIIEFLLGRGYQILPISEDTHISHQQVNN